MQIIASYSHLSIAYHPFPIDTKFSVTNFSLKRVREYDYCYTHVMDAIADLAEYTKEFRLLDR